MIDVKSSMIYVNQVWTSKRKLPIYYYTYIKLGKPLIANWNYLNKQYCISNYCALISRVLLYP